MTTDNLPAVPADIHYEVDLDPEPDTAEPEPVDGDPEPGGLLLAAHWAPIVPEHLRTRAGIRKAVGGHAHEKGHSAAVHAVRLPWYVAQAIPWAIVGALRVAARQVHWAWAMEQHPLRSDAVIAGDSREYLKLHKEAKADRRFRGLVLAAEAAALGAAVIFLVFWAPWWGQALACTVALCLLAHTGRPADRPIISHAIVKPRFRRLSADIVLRAYYAAGLGHPDKPDQQVTFGSTMQRDGEGSSVLIDLPYGKGLKHAVAAKDDIASGLDVAESQVFIRRDPSSYRRHTLWVADRDPLAVPVGRTPLLACKPTDIWKPAPMGLDERGQLVGVPIIWNSVLVGALPRQGKTFSARLLGLYCALDPHVRLDVFDAKGSPDWRKFALVADRRAFGLTPTKDGKPPEILLETLERIKDDVQGRYERLSELEAQRPDLCPQGKLTRELARDPKFGMPVRVLVLEEVQEYYDLGEISKQIAALLVYLVKVAPGAGVSVIASTQKPSGIGSGQIATQFTSFRDQMQVRFSLRTSSWQVSEMVLGQGAYSEGLDSSTLLPQYKGVGILRGATDQSPTVRTYLADGQDADKILRAARAIRERAGTLSGMALGESMPEPETSILADVLAVMGDAPGMHWQVLAPLLAARFPDRHADCTPESVSAQCRAAAGEGISVDVKYLGKTRMGCRREHLQAAAARAAR